MPEEPGAEEPTSPEESSGLSLLHQESKRRAMLASVLEQELPTLAENLRLKQEQVGAAAPALPGGRARTGSLRTASLTPPPTGNSLDSGGNTH